MQSLPSFNKSPFYSCHDCLKSNTFTQVQRRSAPLYFFRGPQDRYDLLRRAHAQRVHGQRMDASDHLGLQEHARQRLRRKGFHQEDILDRSGFKQNWFPGAHQGINYVANSKAIIFSKLFYFFEYLRSDFHRLSAVRQTCISEFC
jgi:hypothetical protein